MRPQLQSQRDDVQGFGDCHRTCIAMILDLDRDEVPHFMDGVPVDAGADHPLAQAAEKAERDWLATYHGLTPVYVAFDGTADLGQVLQVLSVTCRDTAVIIGGVSAGGVNHSVVYYQGRIYNPSFGTLAGPQPDGNWWVTIYAHLTNPLPPAPVALSVVIQED